MRTLSEYGELALEDLGPKVRVDYAPDGEYGRAWLKDLLADLQGDELVAVEDRDGEPIARLRE